MKLLVIDPTQLPEFGSKYEYRNVLTSDSIFIDPRTLDPGFETVFRRATFYEQPALSLRYYCEDVSDATAHLCLVESFSHSTLCQARVEVPLRDSSRYLEITDQGEIGRLRSVYSNSFGRFV